MACIDNQLLIELGGVEKFYERGEYIFDEGAEPRFFFSIVSGSVRVFNVNKEGKEFTQGLFSDGQCFGEAPMVLGKRYPSSAAALRDTHIIRLSRDKFLTSLNEYPSMQRIFIEILATRIYNKAVTTREIVNNPPEVRIIGFLNYHKQSVESGSDPVYIPFTRQEIADFTGLRVETVIRAIKKMEKDGLLIIDKRKIYY